MKTSVEERFWSKVTKTDSCWVWTRATSRGYGHFGIGKKNISAHRFSWLIHRGQIPDEMHVLHRCDNRACVNPEHLFLGTNLDNVRDMVRKKRNARGMMYSNAKLTDASVAFIREQYLGGGYTQQELADELGVSISQINSVLSGKTWKHV